MVRLTKIYTRTGDDGSTALVGGERVPKHHLRIECYGTVDELNACIGLVRERLKQTSKESLARAERDGDLETIQQDLFNLGSSLATRLEQRWKGQPTIDESHIKRLEKTLDAMNEQLPSLNSFVLPGGGPVGAQLHLARTVCRRAERCVARLSEIEAVDPMDLRYLNRLSDLLFVMGRWIAQKMGEPETLWTP